MIQNACLDPQEAFAMVKSASNDLEPEIRNCFKVMKMVILILLKSCYRSSLSIGTPSKWYLEWIWSKRMDLLVQVLENWSLCVKLHFHGNLKSVFGMWWFWAYDNDPKSSGISFRGCLDAHLVHLAKVSRNGLFCSFLEKWLDLQLQICFRPEVWCL